jgi:GGDEF domain-containing protein/Mg-chelatase subunit ChlD
LVGRRLYHNGPIARIAGRRRHIALALVAALSALVPPALHAQTADLTPAPGPTAQRPSLDFVFAVDTSAGMAAADSGSHWVEGLAKAVHVLGDQDRIGVIRFGAAATVAVPLTSVAGGERPRLVTRIRGLAGDRPASGVSNAAVALRAALNILTTDARSGATPVVVVLSEAATARPSVGAEDPRRAALESAVTTCRGVGITLYAVTVGTELGSFRVFRDALGERRFALSAASGAEAPQRISAVLHDVLGLSTDTRPTRLEAEQTLQQSVSVLPQSEMLELDLAANPSDAEMRVTLFDPRGRPVEPAYAGPAGAFYRVQSPVPGAWRYRLTAPRNVQVARGFRTASGVHIATYFPAVVAVKKASRLFYAVETPRGKVTDLRIPVGGRVYEITRQLVEAGEPSQITVTGPDGQPKELAPSTYHADRESPLAGEFEAVWTPRVPGDYSVHVIVRAKEDSRYFHIERTTSIRVVEEKDLPVLALRQPQGGKAFKVANVKKKTNLEPLEIVAQVIEPGAATASPYMLGRVAVAKIEMSGGLTVKKRAKGEIVQTLTGYRRRVGPRDPLGPEHGQVYLFPDRSEVGKILYAFPGEFRDSIYLDRHGYYQVSLVPEGTYRVHPELARVTLRAGGRVFDSTVKGLLLAGGAIVFLGGLLYSLVGWGIIDLTPPAPPERLEDVLIESAFEFVNVIDEFSIPYIIPEEIAVYENRALTHYTILEHESILAANYLVKSVMGTTEINGQPIKEDVDLHMMPGDLFSVGEFLAEIVGMESLIQFKILEDGGYAFVNAVTERETFRWTLTLPDDKRIPPQPDEEMILNCRGKESLLIGRDEGFQSPEPNDLALFHSGVGQPHARLIKRVYLDDSIGYDVEAVKGSIYVNDKRALPGEIVEELRPDTVLKIGPFSLRLNWRRVPEQPEFLVLEAPPPEPFPIPTIMTGVLEEAAAEAAVQGETDLGALFGQPAPEGAAEAAPAEDSGLEALLAAEVSRSDLDDAHLEADQLAALEAALRGEAEATDEEGAVPAAVQTDEGTAALEALLGQETADEEASLDELLAATREEATPTPSPEQPAEEASSLEALFAQTAQEEALTPEEEALLDPATRLPNPTVVEGRLADEWRAVKEADIEMSVVLLDLERAMAAAGGERLMPQVARVLREQFSEVGFVGRLDNARLVVVLPNVPLSEAAEAAEMMRGLVRSALDGAEGLLLGVAARRENEFADPETLIQSVQEAMQGSSAAAENVLVYGRT